jgi:hypothetical protein
MIPGTLTCPGTLATDYKGFLFSTHPSASRSEYICIDQEAKVAGSADDLGGQLLYPVESVSGSGALMGYIANMVRNIDTQQTCL